MRIAIVRTVLLNEMKCAFRDRNLVAHFVLIPLLLYPLMLWLGVTVALLVEARSERISYRIATAGIVDPGLLSVIEADPVFSMLPGDADPQVLLESGRVDAVIEAELDTAGSLAGCSVFADMSRERSRMASERLESLLSALREGEFEALRESIGIGGAEWEVVRVDLDNEAGARDMGGFILGLLLPATFAVMVSIGCFYQSVDAFAGERERRSFETLLSTSASRFEILAGKYLSILTTGLVSGLLNTVSMAICIKAVLGPLLGRAGESVSFTISPALIPLILFSSVILSAFISAGMTASVSMARSFKEGQAMVTPFYMATIIPVIFLQLPGLEYSAVTAAVPVLNAALLLKGSLGGPVDPLHLLISAASTLLLCAGMLTIASRVVSLEEAVFPGETPLKPRALLALARRGGKVGDA